MCTHNQCFEHKIRKYQFFEWKISIILQMKKILYIACVCFHNENLQWPSDPVCVSHGWTAEFMMKWLIE